MADFPTALRIGSTIGYRCPLCDWRMVVLIRDEGTIFHSIPCNRSAEHTLCQGRARMYQTLREEKPTHEYYRPTDIEVLMLSRQLQFAIRRGMLMLRPIDGEVQHG